MRTALYSIASLAFTALLLARPVTAADHAVHMTSFYEFVPDYLEIQTGDTVTWYNDGDDSFGARCDTGFVWDTGGVEVDGQSEPVLFTTIGTFQYYDPTYYSIMKGTIVVNAATVPVTPALIVEPRMLAGGNFSFTVTNLTAGKTTVVEASTNLLNWTGIATNVPTGGTLAVTNQTTETGKFFRSFQIP
jgi:plastocyanin